MKKLIAFALLISLLAGCAPGENEPIEIAPEETAAPEGTAAPTLTPAESTAPLPEEAWIAFMNVGKADAALVCSDGEYWLIDTGTKDAGAGLVSALKAMGVERLSGVFLTHTHKDHTGGLAAVAEAFEVGMLYRAAITLPNDNGEDKLTKLAEKNALPETKLSAGDTMRLGGISMSVIGPLSLNTEDDNDNSLVMLLEVNGRRVLMTGDMQFAEENELMAAGAELECDVLKVGNHGNPDATGGEFALAASPKIAVISTDTAEDEDSANPRVISALSMAEALVTEKYDHGIKIDLLAEGLSAAEAAPPIEERAEELAMDARTMLINRENLLEPDYVPENLVNISDYSIPAITLKKDSIRGEEEAVLVLGEMMSAAEAEGVSGFYLVSVYRTFEEQEKLWDKKVSADPSYGADPNEPIVTAYPGASEHQTGLAFDISAVDARALSADFAKTPQGEWLYANCHRFGFILRYPEWAKEETKIVFEPWHFRYVGTELARYLTDEGMTMEGFYRKSLG